MPICLIPIVAIVLNSELVPLMKSEQLFDHVVLHDYIYNRNNLEKVINKFYLR